MAVMVVWHEKEQDTHIFKRELNRELTIASRVRIFSLLGAAGRFQQRLLTKQQRPISQRLQRAVTDLSAAATWGEGAESLCHPPTNTSRSPASFLFARAPVRPRV